MNWQTAWVQVARAGDLAYQLANYEISVNKREGMPINDCGKQVAVWKKQSDESWKVVTDTWYRSN